MQRIPLIHNENGVPVTKNEEIAYVFVKFFKNMLGAHSPRRQNTSKLVFEQGNKLTVEHQLKLLKPVNSKEVKKVFFEMNDSKSPGPDGYGSGFYKATWLVISTDITETDNPSQAGEYRPTACCNILYKAISKLLCIRLREVLPFLISQNQSAFVE